MRLIYAFIRAAFHNTAIYRFDFWIGVVAVFIMMYAGYSLWNILYQQEPNAFGLDLAYMTTYGALGMLLFAVLDAATVPQDYIAEHVRLGTLELDLVKPLDFIRHMLYRSLGEFGEAIADVEVAQAELIGLEGRKGRFRFNRHDISASELIVELARKYPIKDISVEEPEIETTIREIYLRSAAGQDWSGKEEFDTNGTNFTNN